MSHEACRYVDYSCRSFRRSHCRRRWAAPSIYIATAAPFAFRKVSKWAGLEHSEEVIQRAITRSSFKSMRRKEEAGGLVIFDEKYPNRDKNWRMTRKGKAGGWEECFTSPVSKDIFNDQAYTTLLELGYVTEEKW